MMPKFVATLCAMMMLASDVAAESCVDSPLWQDFLTHLVSEDGRVIDITVEEQISTSEGQSYGMFLALVANDRARFDQFLKWTQDNLAQGDLTQHLPAWKWGKDRFGVWRVLDPNPASDADVWMAYALLEAGRLWNNPLYTEQGRSLAKLVMDNEVMVIPGLGRMLLPGPMGFRPSSTRWRLNPSYLPVQVLRGLATHLDDPAWQELAESAVVLLKQTSPYGYAPNWSLYDSQDRWITDDNTDSLGSYDAIRVYLWIGMMDINDPAAKALQKKYSPIFRYFIENNNVPEVIDVATGSIISAGGPIGFSYAVLPLFQTLAENTNQHQTLAALRQALKAQQVDGYYNRMLRLFSTFWIERFYRFERNGRLLRGSACS